MLTARAPPTSALWSATRRRAKAPGVISPSPRLRCHTACLKISYRSCLTAHWWWISGRRRWFSRTSASPTPGRQLDAVVEGAALAALVAPDVRLPDGLHPVDRIEERDGLVADGLQAGQGHLDELPLVEIEQAPVTSGRPRDRLRQGRPAGGGGRHADP